MNVVSCGINSHVSTSTSDQWCRCILQITERYQNSGRNSAGQAASGENNGWCFRLYPFFWPRVAQWRTGRAAASQLQRFGFDTDLGCCLCGVSIFSLWLHGFPLSMGFLPSPKAWVCRLIGLCELPLVCGEWIRKWDNIEQVWTGDRWSVTTQWAAGRNKHKKLFFFTNDRQKLNGSRSVSGEERLVSFWLLQHLCFVQGDQCRLL